MKLMRAKQPLFSAEDGSDGNTARRAPFVVSRQHLTVSGSVASVKRVRHRQAKIVLRVGSAQRADILTVGEAEALTRLVHSAAEALHRPGESLSGLTREQRLEKLFGRS